VSAKNKEKEKPDLGASGKWLRKLSRSLGGEAQDRGELVANLREAESRGIIEGDALAMLEGVLGVADIQVRDIMVPRSQMTFLNRDDESDVLLKTVVESGHSRFPVLDEDREKVVGILLAKDLLRLAAQDPDLSDGIQFDIKEFMRPAVFVPESKRLNILLKEFRRNRNHMAIVVDEYGGVSGLVTIEDVIEQIVGEIDDEFDVEDDSNIRREGERQFAVRGVARIDEFNEYFSTKLPEGEYDTVAGLIMKQLGRLPRRGEILNIGGFEFRVVRSDRRRIDTLRVTSPRDVLPPEERQSNGS
jgi:magnesium and cobalt transporter